MAKKEISVIPIERIRHCIFLLRGEKVMLDRDLAELYGVQTKRLNEAVKRNADRFPLDFMFQLTDDEESFLRSQFATSNDGRGGIRYNPYAFTEQGVAMLSSVLRSKRAVEVNIAIMRTFVQIRRILADNAMLREKIEEMEKKYDEQFQQVFAVLQAMIAEDAEPRPQIGFHTEAKGQGLLKLRTKKAQQI